MNHAHHIVWLEAHGLRLGLLPAVGGGVTAWQKLEDAGAIDLWRSWNGQDSDAFAMASFALAPWSNRIGGGGFEHEGRFYPILPNRPDQQYPIHGDNWMQAWHLDQCDADSASASLKSRRFQGNPYEYDAQQRWQLVPGGLDQSLRVTHRGAASLPYGLGFHPWLPRSRATRLYASVSGTWLSGADLLSSEHTQALPETWNLPTGAPMQAPFIDNVFTGWDGLARTVWPERGLALDMRMLPLETPQGEVTPAYFHLYRPDAGPAFCIEPVTQPINAFHLEGRPGLVTLSVGESLMLRVQWRLQALDQGA